MNLLNNIFESKELNILPENKSISIRNNGDISIPFGNTNLIFKSKIVNIGGRKYNIDPRELMNLIRQLTRQVGEYKNQDNPYSASLLPAIRKARDNAVSQLATSFRIQWVLDREGNSVFTME